MRWTSVIFSSGAPTLDGSRPIAAATMPMAGTSVDCTNCLIRLDRVPHVDAVSTSVRFEVHMHDPTGREVGVDAHFVGHGIE